MGKRIDQIKSFFKLKQKPEPELSYNKPALNPDYVKGFNERLTERKVIKETGKLETREDVLKSYFDVVQKEHNEKWKLNVDTPESKTESKRELADKKLILLEGYRKHINKFQDNGSERSKYDKEGSGLLNLSNLDLSGVDFTGWDLSGVLPPYNGTSI